MNILSEIEKKIDAFNNEANALKVKRESLVKEMEAANLGKRFAARVLASVTVKMPEGK